MGISSISLQNAPALFFYVTCVVSVMAMQCGEVSSSTEIFVERYLFELDIRGQSTRWFCQ